MINDTDSARRRGPRAAALLTAAAPLVAIAALAATPFAASASPRAAHPAAMLSHPDCISTVQAGTHNGIKYPACLGD